MRKLSLTLLLGMVFYSSKSQTYNQYEYNNAGVPVKTGYVTVTPTQPQFAPYVPSVDVNANNQTQQTYKDAIQRKQAQYDANVKELQSLFDNIYKMNERILIRYPDLGKTIADIMTTYGQMMSSNKYDYSDGKVFGYWYNELNKMYQDNYQFSN